MSIKIPQLLYSSFDFSAYNQTQFTGLDNLLPNSYCNAVLQMLYFIPALRAYMLNHICAKDNCLSCQMGFLFRMVLRSLPSFILCSSASLSVAGSLCVS